MKSIILLLLLPITLLGQKQHYPKDKKTTNKFFEEYTNSTEFQNLVKEKIQSKIDEAYQKGLTDNKQTSFGVGIIWSHSKQGPVVKDIIPNSPAWEFGGFTLYDTITYIVIDHKTYSLKGLTQQQVIDIWTKPTNKPITFTIKQNNNKKSVSLIKKEIINPLTLPDGQYLELLKEIQSLKHQRDSLINKLTK